MDIYIFGTCRVCYPVHDQITFAKQLREYHSRYYTIGTDIHIYTEPVNYTTKLVDVLDSILYMKGKLYATLDPKTNKMLQSIFFRGHRTIEDVIRPKTHPNGKDTITFDKVIIEAFSIKTYVLNTRKYGDEYYGQNLPWKIETGYEHDIHFDEHDIITKVLSKAECFEILDRIKEEVGCQMLIIGPYLSTLVPDEVNQERKDTQDILKAYTQSRGEAYMDMSEETDFEADVTHFTEKGTRRLSDMMYQYIVDIRA